jgi:hypothetical protein
MGIASAVHGAVGRASLSWAPSPRASSRTAHPDHVGYHPWPELGAAVRNATPHADADATAIEILGLVMARFTFYKSNDRLIERPHPADYDLDQLRMMECGSHLERRRGVYASGALAAESDWRSPCRWPHWFGLGLFGGGVKLITVLQLRHENVSNCALFSSDLPLSIASPHSGQCRMGGRD